MAKTFAPRPSEWSDPWWSTYEAHEKSVETAINEVDARAAAIEGDVSLLMPWERPLHTDYTTGLPKAIQYFGPASHKAGIGGQEALWEYWHGDVYSAKIHIPTEGATVDRIYASLLNEAGHTIQPFLHEADGTGGYPGTLLWEGSPQSTGSLLGSWTLSSPLELPAGPIWISWICPSTPPDWLTPGAIMNWGFVSNPTGMGQHTGRLLSHDCVYWFVDDYAQLSAPTAPVPSQYHIQTGFQICSLRSNRP